MRLLIHDYAGHPFQVQLSRELARRGHAVTHAFAGGLLTPRGSLQKQADDPEQLELVEVPMDANYRRDKYRFLRRRRMEINYGKEIAALIKKLKPQIVISANTPTEPQWEIARVCRELRVQFIPWIQDFYSIAVTKLAKKKLPVIGSLVGWWYRSLEKQTLRQASKILVITSDFVPILQQFGIGPNDVVVIPNWAPLNELPQQGRQNAWSQSQKLDDKFVFLYSGTLAMKHNPDLLKQLAVTFRADPQVKIMVISEGPGADYLDRSKKTESLTNLEILPFQPFKDVPNINATADVLVAILETDAGIFSVPSKVLTYLCAGRPILAAIPSQNLASRIISGCRAGATVEPTDMNGFLAAARELRQNQTKREECSVSARAYADDNFNVEAIASRFEACFQTAPKTISPGDRVESVTSPEFSKQSLKNI
jgi:glycosyltransferase involved in cell wall biosynthesis